MNYGYLPSWISTELERLGRLIEYVNGFLTDQAADAEAAQQTALDAHVEAQTTDSFMDFFAAGMEANEVSEAFPNLIYASLFLSLYSFLENTLDQLTKYLAREEGEGKVTPKELSHRGIFRSQVYHQKVMDIPFPDQSDAWERVEGYNRVRNSLIHSYGRVSADGGSNALRSFISATNGVEIVTGSWNQEQLSLNYDFVKLAYEDVVSVLRDLAEVYAQRSA
ncbi:hypothetical protein [Rubricoccus marinus]|uniref:RiboL-PSP-HEPN domain-containing protein n=1 Tax=Rubricoccus marinus TaxID=716817 RepID=A0A259TZH3_9BACT|nr:hypothetical protein [Rubricoccus marinus]OZC03121.1 hypothetical protein BSZ36_09130 [Rubricoccus marinus]